MKCAICNSKKITITAYDGETKERGVIGYMCGVHDSPPHHTPFWDTLFKKTKDKLDEKEKRQRNFSKQYNTICGQCRNRKPKKMRQYHSEPKHWKITCLICGNHWGQNFSKTARSI